MTLLSFLSLLLLLLLLLSSSSSAGLISEPVNTVPAFPVQTSQSGFCHLDLSDELFGGVNAACGNTLDRSRCCPVLAAWLFSAYARSALSLSTLSPSPSPSPSSAVDDSTDLPMMPEDTHSCVDSLQTSLLKRNIKIPQPNASCDAVLCFCGIRLHQIASLTCPAAFNVSVSPSHRNATPTAAVRSLEKNCLNSSYSGCTKCLGSLQKLKVEGKNGTSWRETKMFNRDCKLMGLTWLLALNKTKYIPTVSAVLRAMMYSPHPHENRCTPDQENMPLAVDSLQFDDGNSSGSSVLEFSILPLSLALYYTLVNLR